MIVKLILSGLFISTFSVATNLSNSKKNPLSTNRNEERVFKAKLKYQQQEIKVNSGSEKAKSEGSVTTPESNEPKTLEKVKDIKNSESLSCKAYSEERGLELIKKGSGCEVIYTKKGISKVIAHQNLGHLRCDDVFYTLRDKLVKAGFNCEPK
ncbi:MAG: hypothetical protein KDD45_15895 [Bdellovibrionales bacterium]|nr:hypothetical protein [Bdellovibrionales bacterium]